MSKLEEMLKYVSEHNEFYKNRIKEYGIKDPLDINQWPESKVYNYDPTMIEALFRTYEPHPILGIGNRINYYIIYDYEELTTKDYTYYSECNFDNPNWRFRLIKDLEIFYAKVLDSIVVHGSCIRYLEKNILLLGARRSGKTTLTHYLSIKKMAHI